MDAYFARFGGVRDYLMDVVEQARKDGYTSTVLGRRRYLPELDSSNRQVREAAEQTAAHGVALAQQAGFQATGMATQGAPTWKSIVAAATEHGVSLIVLGSHRRTGLAGHLLGSVAAEVAAHSTSSVLIVHRPACPGS